MESKRMLEGEFAEQASHKCNANDGSVVKPCFSMALPKMLRQPEIASREEMECQTRVACHAIRETISQAIGIQVVFDHFVRLNPSVRKVLEESRDVESADGASSVSVAISNDWLHTIPSLAVPMVPPCGDRLHIYVGAPGKGLATCTQSNHAHNFDTAYAGGRLIVLCRGVCMLPVKDQEHNVFGVDESAVLDVIVSSITARGPVVWGLDAGTKDVILEKAYGQPLACGDFPLAELTFAADDQTAWDFLAGWCRYTNEVKLAQPSMPVVNYYDSGLTVNRMMVSNAARKLSLLSDADGLAISKEGSIGHMISKLNQLATVKPYVSNRGVYSFWIGDGACRLNGGMELAFHHMESYKGNSMMTLFVFNNHVWAVEDNLVDDAVEEHKIPNTDFYDLLAAYPNVRMCEDEGQLRSTLLDLGAKTDAFLKGTADPEFAVIVIRGIDAKAPPVFGDLSLIRSSSDMTFLRDTLGAFAADCKHEVPIYGCSHFESIQFLHMFLEEMPEGQKYQYVCGRTDIQAAHMCGFEQPDGKCVLFINDVFGIHSLGESLRAILAEFGGRQLLLMIWHPMLLDVLDHFNLHRQPMVWPSVGPHLASYYIRTAKDAFFYEFDGKPTSKVREAIDACTPLVVVNMLPSQERGNA